MNRKKVVVGTLAAALLAVGGFSAMAVAESPTTEQGSSQAENTKTDPDNIQLQEGDQNAPDNAGQAEEQETNGPDTDNVQLQEGNQTEDGD
jgi:hypothetical protein